MRKIQPADLDRVVEITKASLPDAWSKSYFEKLYQQYPDAFFVTEKDNQIVGYILGYLKSERLGWIKAIAVSPDCQGRGMGTKMIGFIADYLKRMGAEKIGLRTRISNQASVSFYRRLGFEITDTVKDYFPNGEDAHLMRKEL